VNRRGENFQKRAQRDWLPGRCGLLPLLPFGATDSLLRRRSVADAPSQDGELATGFGKGGTRLRALSS
jgi:hypothetical protein